MADDVDIANSLRDIELDWTLNRIRQQTPSVGSPTCVECGDAIPEERKKLGYKLCVSCAQEMERINRQFAG